MSLGHLKHTINTRNNFIAMRSSTVFKEAKFCQTMPVAAYKLNIHKPSQTNTHKLLQITVDSRYLDIGYLEQPLISKKKSGPCLNIEI